MEKPIQYCKVKNNNNNKLKINKNGNRQNSPDLGLY